MRPITRISAFTDPPLTLGVWLDAYSTRLKNVDLTANEAAPAASQRPALAASRPGCAIADPAGD